MQVIGYALMVFACGLWIVGGASVNRQHRRRMGEEIEPFSARNIPTKDLSADERRSRLTYLWASMAVGGLGAFIASMGHP